MKPNLMNLEKNSCRTEAFRAGTPFAKTDCSYSNPGMLDGLRGSAGNNGANIRSFRKLSDNYFGREAHETFVGEAALFGIIGISAVISILSAAHALGHLLKVIGSV